MTTPYCDDSVLESDTGPVNIEINWEPNEINLRWYNNNTLITPSNNASNTCTYDEVGLTMPSAPTRTGYTFKGWRARPQYDFSNLTFTATGTKIGYGKGFLNNEDFCRYYYKEPSMTSGTYHVGCELSNVYTGLQQMEWETHFPEGTVYGMAYCSRKTGDNNEYNWTNSSSNWSATYNELVAANEGETMNCWCKATGYKAANTSIIYRPSTNLSWILSYPNISNINSAYCWRVCSTNCATYIITKPGMKTVLFAPQ